MLDLVASPNTIHFVVDQRDRGNNHFTQLITTCGKKDYEKEKATQQTAWNINKWGDVGEI